MQEIEQFCELETPLVLVVADRIEDVSEISPILELVKKVNRPLFLVSEDLREEPMSTMIYNNEKDIVKCCAINIPWLNGI
jgi:chaperonin GroEL